MAQKALDCGVPHGATSGRLKRYLDSLYLLHGHGNNTRIYGEHLFIFEGPVLITVLYLPNHLRRAARKTSRPIASRHSVGRIALSLLALACTCLSGCIGARYSTDPQDGGKPGWDWHFVNPFHRSNP